MRAYGLSTSGVIDDVTWLYDVILVKSQSSKTSHSKDQGRLSVWTDTAVNVSHWSDHLHYISANVIIDRPIGDMQKVQ